MPYSTKEKRALGDKQRRQQALLDKAFCCSRCQCVFESTSNLKRHEKGSKFEPSAPSTEGKVERLDALALLRGDCEAKETVVEAVEGEEGDEVAALIDGSIYSTIEPGVFLSAKQVHLGRRGMDEDDMRLESGAVSSPPSTRVGVKVTVDCRPLETSSSTIQDDKPVQHLGDEEEAKGLSRTERAWPINPAPGDFVIPSSQLEEDESMLV